MIDACEVVHRRYGRGRVLVGSGASSVPGRVDAVPTAPGRKSGPKPFGPSPVFLCRGVIELPRDRGTGAGAVAPMSTASVWKRVREKVSHPAV